MLYSLGFIRFRVPLITNNVFRASGFRCMYGNGSCGLGVHVQFPEQPVLPRMEEILESLGLASIESKAEGYGADKCRKMSSAHRGIGPEGNLKFRKQSLCLHSVEPWALQRNNKVRSSQLLIQGGVRWNAEVCFEVSVVVVMGLRGIIERLGGLSLSLPSLSLYIYIYSAHIYIYISLSLSLYIGFRL